MTVRWLVVGVWNLTVLVASPAGAQSASGSSAVPDGFKPPAGMCRIWIDGVPADRQPAPTDCATAVRRRPANAHVVFGDQPAASVSTPGNPAPSNASSSVPASAAPLSVHETAAPDVKPEFKSEPRPAGMGGGPTPVANFGAGAPPAFIVHTAPRPASHAPAPPTAARPAAPHGGQTSATQKSTAPVPVKHPPRGH